MMLLVVLFVCFFTAAHAIIFNVTYLRIPAVVPAGQHDVEFECHYEGNFSLLNWFKGRREFFRYKPGGTPSIMSFPLAGVERVEMEACGPTMCRLRLAGLSEEASGMYRCDIERDIPPYKFATKIAYMNVSSPVHRKPMIEGLADEYFEGDIMQAYCRAESNIELRWYINGREIKSLRGSRHFKYVSNRRIFMSNPPMIVVQCSEVVNGKILGSAGMKAHWMGFLGDRDIERNHASNANHNMFCALLIISASVTAKINLHNIDVIM